MFRIFSLFLIAVSLTACASQRFEADVVRFHTMGPDIESRSISIVPARPGLEGLEFTRYANLIGERLRSFGFRPATQGEPAELLALVDYSVMPRALLNERGDSPVSVGVGVGGVGSHVGVSVGTVFGVGERRQDKVFARTLSLQLKDISANEVIFEGRVMSEGEEGSLPVIMPNMVDALFADFPGPSGETTHFEQSLNQE